MAHSYGDKEHVAAVVISTRSGLRIKMDVPAWWRPGNGTAQSVQQPASAPLPSGCTREIIETLRDVGRRLTGEQLQHEMEQRGLRYSDSKLRLTAGVMVELGVLTNEQQTNPKGYGLPEWDAGR